MNKLIPLLLTIFLLVSLPLVGQTHEIRRPTADSDLQQQCGPDTAVSPAPVFVASPSMPNGYDASGTATSSNESVTGVSGNQKIVGHHFFSFPFPSAAYKSLTINVNASGTDSNGNIFIGVSIDGGTSFNPVKIETNTGGFAQQTFSLALSTSTAFSSLQVNACSLGNSPSGTASVTVFDIWTDGVLWQSPGTPTGLLVASSIDGHSNTLTWTNTDVTGDVTSNHINRCTGAGCTPTLRGSASSAATSFTDGGASNATTYGYQVCSSNPTFTNCSTTTYVTTNHQGGSGHSFTSP